MAKRKNCYSKKWISAFQFRLTSNLKKLDQRVFSKKLKHSTKSMRRMKNLKKGRKSPKETRAEMSTEEMTRLK